jgi:acyl-CoA thioesterase-1
MRKVALCFALCLPVSAACDEVVIAAFGDSLTQGYGLLPEDGFVARLQEWLDAEGIEARLVNAGVSGDTTAGGLARVGWTLTPEVDGMLVTLGGNDLLRGLDPDLSRENLAGILQAAAEADVAVLLVGMEAPGNFGPEYKAAFDAIYPDLAEEYGAIYAESFFAGLNVAGGDPASVRAFMQPDGIHPNAIGVRLIVEALGPKVAELVRRADD